MKPSLFLLADDRPTDVPTMREEVALQPMPVQAATSLRC